MENYHANTAGILHGGSIKPFYVDPILNSASYGHSSDEVSIPLSFGCLTYCIPYLGHKLSQQQPTSSDKQLQRDELLDSPVQSIWLQLRWVFFRFPLQTS